MKQLHDIQLQILNKLLFAPGLTYTQMKPDPQMENNTFDWHVRQLLKLKLISKDNGEYKLTSQGKKYTSRLDTDQIKVQFQAKLTVWIGCVRQEDNKREFLIYTRKKHPFFGCQGFPGGKIQQGETVVQAAQRELKEECNLSGTPELIHIHHYITRRQETDELIEDKFMFLCRVHNPQGLLQGNEEGEYTWIKESELKDKITNPFGTMKEFEMVIDLLKNYNGPAPLTEEKEFITKDGKY